MRLLIPLITFILLSIYSTTSGVEEFKGPTLNGYLCPSCYERAKTVLEKAWTLSDPLITCYGVLAYHILKLEVPKAQEVCKYLQTGLDNQDGSKLEMAFALSSAITRVQGCKAGAIKPTLKQVLDKVLKDGGSSQDVFYAIEILKNTGNAVDGAKVAELIKTGIKTDDTPQSLGYGFWASATAFKNGQKLDGIWDRIEDVVAQADEVDKQFLQYEGGLSVTAVVVNGVFRLAEVAGKAFPLTSEQVVKFSNYLISRKSVNTPRGLWLFLSALDAVAGNKFLNPVYVGISGSNVLNDANKVVSIRVADLFGKPVDVAVSLDSLTDSTGKKVADVQLLQAVLGTDKTIFNVDLKSKTLTRGFYNAVIVPKSPKNDKKLILLPTTVQFKVVGKLGTVTARLGVADADQQTPAKWHDLNMKQKLNTKLDVETNQKLVVKVSTAQRLHQVFVVLRNKETKKEVTFIGQPETEGKTDYKLELDLTSNAKDLGYEAGTYELTLILGDFFVEDPVEWALGEAKLHVAPGKPKTPNSLYSISYGPKPDIQHLFRTPDPRPPRVLSDAFTVLALVPLAILFILWFKLGANINGFPFSLSAILFHVGLAGIFGVYVLFWLKLTMFEALKLLSIPGLIAFIFGHRLLSYLSEKRKA